jgi:hypothetical protein
MRIKQAAGTARALSLDLSFKLSCPFILNVSLPNGPSWVRVGFNLLTKKAAKRFMGGGRRYGMLTSMRKTYDTAFKAKVAFEAAKAVV